MPYSVSCEATLMSRSARSRRCAAKLPGELLSELPRRAAIEIPSGHGKDAGDPFGPSRRKTWIKDRKDVYVWAAAELFGCSNRSQGARDVLAVAREIDDYERARSSLPCYRTSPRMSSTMSWPFLGKCPTPTKTCSRHWPAMPRWSGWAMCWTSPRTGGIRSLSSSIRSRAGLPRSSCQPRCVCARQCDMHGAAPWRSPRSPNV